MGKTVHWAKNCPRISNLRKSVNGEGIHSNPKHLTLGLNYQIGHGEWSFSDLMSIHKAANFHAV